MRELGRMTRLAAAMVAVALAFAGCSGGGPKAVEVSSEADLSGLRVGCTAGSIYEMMLSQRTDIELSTFNAPSDDVEALVSGKVDVMVEDDTFMSPEEMARTGIKLAFRGEMQFPVAFAFSKGNAATAPVRESLSRFIDSLRATGELQKMHDRWFECDTPSRVAMPDLGPEPEGKPRPKYMFDEPKLKLIKPEGLEEPVLDLSDLDEPEYPELRDEPPRPSGFTRFLGFFSSRHFCFCGGIVAWRFRRSRSCALAL